MEVWNEGKFSNDTSPHGGNVMRNSIHRKKGNKVDLQQKIVSFQCNAVKKKKSE